MKPCPSVKVRANIRYRNPFLKSLFKCLLKVRSVSLAVCRCRTQQSNLEQHNADCSSFHSSLTTQNASPPVTKRHLWPSIRTKIVLAVVLYSKNHRTNFKAIVLKQENHRVAEYSVLYCQISQNHLLAVAIVAGLLSEDYHTKTARLTSANKTTFLAITALYSIS